MILRVALVILISLNFLASQAQRKKIEKREASYLEQPNRIEFDINPSDQDFIIVPAEDRGLVIFKETAERGDKGFLWEFNHVDTLLEKRWSKNLLLPYGSFYMGHDYSLGNVYILLGTVSGRSFSDFSLLGLNLQSGDTIMRTVDIGFPVNLNEFEVVGDMAIFGGYANYRPVVLLYNFKTRKKTVLPGFYNNKSQLLDIKTNDEYNNFSVLMTDKFRAKNQTITIKTFDGDGKLIQKNILDPGEDKNLIYGQTASLVDGTQYLSGTYAIRKSSYSKGVYVAKFKDNEQRYLNYYLYSELENFFSYMSAKRQTRVKERIKRRKIKGKKVRLNYRLLVHDVVQMGENNILIGEAYYPKYVLSTYYPLNLQYGNDRYGSGIEGYKYTHAVLIAFDKDGKVIWDNSFEINDILSLDLKQYVHVAGDDDRIVLLYMYEGEIRSKLIEGNEVIEGKTYNPIKLQFQDDIVESEQEDVSGLEEWYENSFFAYGVQRILKEGDRRRREIFYVNKIVYN